MQSPGRGGRRRAHLLDRPHTADASNADRPRQPRRHGASTRASSPAWAIRDWAWRSTTRTSTGPRALVAGRRYDRARQPRRHGRRPELHHRPGRALDGRGGRRRAHLLDQTAASTGTIGRANLDGTGVDQSFITGAEAPPGRRGRRRPHLLDQLHARAAVYAARSAAPTSTARASTRASSPADTACRDGLGGRRRDTSTGPIGDARSRHDRARQPRRHGRRPELHHHRSACRPSGIAVNFSVGKLKKANDKGTAQLTVEVPAPGGIALAQTKKVKGAEVRAEAAGEVQLAIKPTGKAKKKLAEHGQGQGRGRGHLHPRRRRAGGANSDAEAEAMTRPTRLRARPSPTTLVSTLALLAALVLPLALAPRAEAFVYWTQHGPPLRRGTHRARQPRRHGRRPDASSRGGGRTCRPASRSTRAHIYWTQLDADTIGRANLDGTGVDQSFITGAAQPRAGWRSTPPTSTGRTAAPARSGAPTSTARASTRASSPARASPGGVAVDAAHVYWANAGTRHDRARQPRRHGRRPELHHRRRAARAAWRSTPPRLLDQRLAACTGHDRARQPRRHGRRPELHHRRRPTPSAVAVDAAHIYWSADCGPTPATIGRANLDGTGVDQSFINGLRRHGSAPSP